MEDEMQSRNAFATAVRILISGNYMPTHFQKSDSSEDRFRTVAGAPRAAEHLVEEIQRKRRHRSQA